MNNLKPINEKIKKLELRKKRLIETILITLERHENAFSERLRSLVLKNISIFLILS